MPDFELIATIIYGLYFVLGILLCLGIPNSANRLYSQEPPVSVILAVRNEEQHLPACLDSLCRLDYPADKLEVILVDDHSSDSSAQIIAGYAQTRPNIHYYSLPQDSSSRRGKVRALEFGIAVSRGEFIFLTDADCRAPRAWIKSLLTQFTGATAMTGGVTLLDTPNERASLFGKIQSCDWLFLLGIAAAAARYSLPLSWFGNNMAFRRSVYNECGGFAKIGHSLVEDLALLNQVKKPRRRNIKFSFSPDSLLYSSPAYGLAEYYNQRKRWARGLNLVPLPGIVLLILAVLAHSVTIAALFTHPALAAAGIMVLTGADFLILSRAAGLLGRRDLLKFIGAFEIYYFLYTLLLPLLLLFDRKTSWKDRQYPAKAGQQSGL